MVNCWNKNNGLKYWAERKMAKSYNRNNGQNKHGPVQGNKPE